MISVKWTDLESSAEKGDIIVLTIQKCAPCDELKSFLDKNSGVYNDRIKLVSMYYSAIKDIKEMGLDPVFPLILGVQADGEVVELGKGFEEGAAPVIMDSIIGFGVATG